MTETVTKDRTIDRTLLLIGCGQMGGALVRGGIASGVIRPEGLICVDARPAVAEALAAELGTEFRASIQAPSGGDRVFIFAVKPQDLPATLGDWDSQIVERDTVISIAAGVTTAAIAGCLSNTPAVVRAMPNTPAMVGQGVTGIYSDDDEALELAELIFAGVGTVVRLGREAQFDALTAVSGSGPAYVFTMLEALADGAVLMGLDRRTARTLAVETVRGAAALAADDAAHTAELKDRVASPAGTTIAALAALEDHGFRSALIRAVEAAALRSRALGQPGDDDKE